jgi:T5SS/PEP-CTERM-associated repeat protein
LSSRVLTGNVVANGLLEFAQTTPLTTSATISGTGGLAVTNTGTLAVTGLASGTARFNLAISASRGELAIGATGTNPLIVGDMGVGSLSVTGGTVKNGLGFLGFAAGSRGTATVSSGTWQNRGPLYVGGTVGGNGGTGTLTMTGGRVTSTLSSIGVNTTSLGTVTITGGTWNNAANLNVGTSGTGTVPVSVSGSWTGGSFSHSGASLADEAVFSSGDQLWRIDYDATAGGVNRTAEYLPDGRFVNLVAVPEPSAGVLLGIGLLGPALAWRRARRRQGAKNRRFHGAIRHICP